MSSAHKGSRLLLSGSVIAVDFSTAYFDGNNDASGIQYGNIVLPSSNTVYTNRPVEGRFGGGVAVEQGATNLWSGAINIYNNYNSNGQMTASLTALNETFMGQTVYRLQMTPVSANALSSIQTQLSSHGVYGSNMTYQSGNTYMTSIYWRAQKTDISVGGTASNIAGWSDVGTYSSNSGWNRSVAKWNWTGNATDNKFWSFKSPSTVANETLTVDWVCPQIENNLFPTSYISGTRANGRITYPSTIVNKAQGTVSCWINQDYTAGGSWRRIISFVGANAVNGITDLNFDINTTNNIRIKADPSYSVSSTGNIGTANTWYHVACSWGSSGLKVYINGNLDSTNASYTGGITALDSTLSIGARQTDSADYINGTISDFVIYQTQLSDEDMKAIYLSNRPLYNPYDYRATAY